jgi:lipid-A-disaccharide synthase
MEDHGLKSLFPIDDVAVMGPINILAALPRLMRRVYQTVDAAIAFKPDLVVIIDSPEFTHPIAKRIRKRAPQIPIVDYVSPSVWAWRPGRAAKMRTYINEVLGLLPFEPEAHRRLGGPHCTYVGHPLIERLPDIETANAAALGRKLGLREDQPVLLVLPGSRRSEVERLLDVFGGTVGLLAERYPDLAVVIPVVPRLRQFIEERTRHWRVTPKLLEGSSDKFAAMKRARAALAASGTVTLELALAQLPMVVAYKVDTVAAPFLRRLIKSKTVVLANLVLDENAFPEFLQEDCSAEALSAALVPLFDGGAAREAQCAALARMPGLVRLPDGTPSDAAAVATLAVLER